MAKHSAGRDAKELTGPAFINQIYELLYSSNGSGPHVNEARREQFLLAVSDLLGTDRCSLESARPATVPDDQLVIPLWTPKNSNRDRDDLRVYRQAGSDNGDRSAEPRANAHDIVHPDEKEDLPVAGSMDFIVADCDRAISAPLRSLLQQLLSNAYSTRQVLAPVHVSLYGDGESGVVPLTAGITVGDLCESYVAKFKAVLPAEACSIFLWDQSEERLIMTAQDGYTPGFQNYWYVRGERALTLQIATSGDVICASRSELVENPHYSGRCERFLRSRCFANIVGVPLVSHGRIVGVVKLENKFNPVQRTESEPHYVDVRPSDVSAVQLIAQLFVADLGNVQASLLHCTSGTMLETLKRCSRLANSGEPVLLVGAEGSGKERIARYIHAMSRRRSNVKTIPCREVEGLRSISAGLIDYAKKSDFTSGEGELRSLFLEAAGGTIYFDDLTGLTPAAQKLFPHVVRRLSKQDVRVLASIASDPGDLVNAERLDKELQALFVGSQIKIPSLRERLEDIELLARHFAEDLQFRTGATLVAHVNGSSRTDPYTAGDCLREVSESLRAELTSGTRSLEVRDLKAIIERAILQGARFSDILKEQFALAHSVPTIRFQKLSPASKREVIARLWREKVIGPDRWSIARLAEHLNIHERTAHKYLNGLGLRQARSDRQVSSPTQEDRS